MIGIRSDDEVMHRFSVRERCVEMLRKNKEVSSRRIRGHVNVGDEKKNKGGTLSTAPKLHYWPEAV